MNKKIIFSLALIGVAAAIAIGGTVAYFSDTETSVGNTFTAGTIDISIDGQNPWTDTFTLADMKPCYTDYINFKIENDLADPNPVNIFKKIIVKSEGTGVISEPECKDQGGDWTDNGSGAGTCAFVNGDDQNDLSNVIWYDLKVWVHNVNGAEIWHQTIYVDDDKQSINDVYATGEIFLGMIPAGGYMLVEQSYHLKPEAGNKYQGDIMTFDIEVKGIQLYGTAWLENKDISDDWRIVHTDNYEGTLTYKVKHPTFDFSFTGKAQLTGTEYVLVAGPNAADPTIELGRNTTGGAGDITINGTVNTGDMKDAKIWLVPASNWTGNSVNWPSPWTASDGTFLWETGLIWYEDTDL